MAKFGVVYYTRTNNSKRVAEKISNRLSCDLIQITDPINWKGFIGYIKAGFYSMTNRHVDIEVHGDLDDFDEIIVVGPLWAGGIAPALRTFFANVPREKVHLVVTSIDTPVEDRAGYLSVHDVRSKLGNEDAVIDDLVESLTSDTSG
ncbi:hypothetical protein KQH50_03200 [bacterium]|nr:hypothetical protein [bacterium]